MTPEEWAAIERLFHELRARPTEEHSERLARADVPETVRQRVRSMLACAEGDADWLEHPIAGAIAPEELCQPTLKDETFSPGDFVGRYRIEGLIAVGGMGVVYRARLAEGELDHEVAIKVVRSSILSGKRGARTTAERFRREWSVLASLDHPAIPRVLDVGTSEGGTPYIAMQFVDGVPITRYAADRSLSIHDRVDLIIQVCDAIQHAHQRLVLHRDLKPHNVLVTTDGRPVVLDFGVARILNPDGATAGLTRSGEFLGTLAFAAPEQLQGGTVTDTRCDLYAIGVLLYNLLTGHLPHGDTRSLPVLLKRIDERRPKPPSAHDPRIPPDMDAIILKAMAREPGRRYDSAGDLADDLRRFQAGRPVAARSDSRWYQVMSELRIRRVPILAASVIVIASAAFAFYAMRQSRVLEHRNQALELALSGETFERARLLGRTGNLVGAEQILWRQHKQTEPTTRQVTLPWWGLRELYSSIPVEASLELSFELGAPPCRGPNGTLLVVDARDRSVHLLDPERGTSRRLPELGYVQDIVSNLVGETIAWTDEEGTIRLASMQNLEQATLIAMKIDTNGRRDASRSFGLSSTGKRLWSHGGAGLRVLDLETDRSIAIQPSRDARLVRVAFAGEHEIVTLFDDGQLSWWRADNGELVRTRQSTLGLSSTHVATSDDGRFVAVAHDRSVTVYENGDEDLSAAIMTNGWISSLCVTQIGSEAAVLASSADYVLRALMLSPARPLFEITAFSRRPTHLLALSGRPHIVSFDERSRIRIWSLDPAPQATMARTLGAGTALDLSIHPATGQTGIAMDDARNRVVVLDSALNPIAESETLTHPACSVVHDDRAEIWYAATYGGQVVQLERIGRRLVTRWATVLEHRPNQLTIAPNGSYVAVACDGGLVYLLQAGDGAVHSTVNLSTSRVPSIAWMPDSRSLIACTHPESDVVQIDLADDDELRLAAVILDGERAFGFRSVAVSPDGSMLAVAGDDARIRTWDLDDTSTWAPSSTLTGHAEGLFALDYSEDGQLLASAGRQGRVMVWHTTTGRAVASHEVSEDMLFAIRLMQDGTSIVTAGRGALLHKLSLDAMDSRVLRNTPRRQLHAGEFPGPHNP
ncbi:MAG: WD40 repeat domain-containing serine/threonine protein kinase [Phycisphaerales bacterium JB043]